MRLVLRQAEMAYHNDTFTSVAATLPGDTPDVLAADRSTLRYATLPACGDEVTGLKELSLRSG
jgi:hypothetical protein